MNIQLSFVEEASNYLGEGGLLKKQQLLGNTDTERKDRGEDADLIKFKSSDVSSVYGPNYNRMAYEVLSDEHTENRIHDGYFVFNTENKKIRELKCSCSDFKYRMYGTYIDNGYADVDPSERKDLSDTNPNDPDMFLCKHLVCAIDKILGPMFKTAHG